MTLKTKLLEGKSAIILSGVLSGFASYALYRAGLDSGVPKELKQQILFWGGPGTVFGLVLALCPGVWPAGAGKRLLALIFSVLAYIGAVKCVLWLDASSASFPAAGALGGAILGLGAFFCRLPGAAFIVKCALIGAVLGLGFYGLMMMEAPFSYLSFPVWQAGMLVAMWSLSRKAT